MATTGQSDAAWRVIVQVALSFMQGMMWRLSGHSSMPETEVSDVSVSRARVVNVADVTMQHG